MRKLFHQELAGGKWARLSLIEQMSNIGSEVSRAGKWQGKDNNIFWNAVERALELFDLTLEDQRWRSRLKEISRVREVFCDAVLGEKEYKTSLSDLERYFFSFTMAAQRNR